MPVYRHAPPPLSATRIRPHCCWNRSTESLLWTVPASLLSGASVFTPLGPDPPLKARFCTWRRGHGVGMSEEKLRSRWRLNPNLIVIRLAAGGGSCRHFLFGSLRLLLCDGCHGGGCCVTRHENELRGDGRPQGTVDLRTGRVRRQTGSDVLPSCWADPHPQVHLTLSPRRPAQQH